MLKNILSLLSLVLMVGFVGFIFYMMLLGLSSSQGIDMQALVMAWV